MTPDSLIRVRSGKSEISAKFIGYREHPKHGKMLIVQKRTFRAKEWGDKMLILPSEVVNVSKF